jgi:hypothetical protein
MADVIERPAPICAERLTEQQHRGQTCVRCGHLFESRERPRTVACIGMDCHPLLACRKCAPLIQAPVWPAWGSA